MHYDVIGDIHGYSKTLEALLSKLGYRAKHNIYHHPDRLAVFLGDFIDRGPNQREVIGIVRPMLESGSALTVLGNHEFNAIAFATPDPDSRDFLRRHSQKNIQQHSAFLEAYPQDSAEHREIIEWFKTMPLWLDLGGIRVVHACWDPTAISYLTNKLDGPLLNHELLVDACREGSVAYKAIETILKGKEAPLPHGSSFQDKDGNHRNHIRVRWWDQMARTHREAFFGPESARTHIPADPIEEEHIIVYGHKEPPVFLGHYWLDGAPAPLAPNIACLDYSVAKHGGKLVAYRWDGEQNIDATKFVLVEQIDQ